MIDLFGLQFTPVELIITCGVVLAVLLALVILAKMPKWMQMPRSSHIKTCPKLLQRHPLEMRNL